MAGLLSSVAALTEVGARASLGAGGYPDDLFRLAGVCAALAAAEGRLVAGGTRGVVSSVIAALGRRFFTAISQAKHRNKSVADVAEYLGDHVVVKENAAAGAGFIVERLARSCVPPLPAPQLAFALAAVRARRGFTAADLRAAR